MRGHIQRKGNVLELWLGPTPSTATLETHKQQHWVFRLTVQDEDYAELLLRDLNEKIHKLLSSEREHYYHEGWRDAKRKKAKRTWFPISFNSTKR